MFLLILIGEVAMRIWCLYIFRINTSSYATSGTTWLCLATCYIVGKILICRIKVFASIFIIYSMLPSDDICNKYIQHIFLLMCVDQRTHMSVYADQQLFYFVGMLWLNKMWKLCIHVSFVSHLRNCLLFI